MSDEQDVGLAEKPTTPKVSGTSISMMSASCQSVANSSAMLPTIIRMVLRNWMKPMPTNMCTISATDLLNVPIPIPTDKVRARVVELVQESRGGHQEARRLLEEAKRRVEEMVLE